MGNNYIIYLHGRGTSAAIKSNWKDAFLMSLGRAGAIYEPAELDPLFCAPAYSAFLTLKETALDPELTLELTPAPRPQQFERAQSEYQTRLKDLAHLLRDGYPHDLQARALRTASKFGPVSGSVIGVRFRDVEIYCESVPRRQRILKEVLDQLPTSGRCILMGHSLGSIVALDLLNYLPPELHVDLLLTLGSPAGLTSIRQSLTGRGRPFPYHRVSSWVNVYDANDPVTGGIPLARHFKGKVVDHQVENGGLSQTHNVDEYLDHVRVGDLLWRAVRPYLGREISTLVVPEEKQQRAVLYDLAVQQKVRTAIIKQTKDARTRARRRVADRHLLTQAMQVYGVDDPDVVHEHMDEVIKSVAVPEIDHRKVKLMIVQRTGSPFYPFAIDPSDGTFHAALVEVAQELGLPAALADKVCQAVLEARGAHKRSKWPLVAVGGLAVAAAALAMTGVGAAAAPGLAGAAATASGLATLGSLAGGGMATGLFVVAGSGALSAGLATSAIRMMDPEQVEEAVVMMQAEALIAAWGKDQETARSILNDLKTIKTESRRMQREHSHVDDEGTRSPTVKAYKRKGDAASRAVTWLKTKI